MCACVREMATVNLGHMFLLEFKFDTEVFSSSFLPLSFSVMIRGDFSTNSVEFSSSRVSVVKQSIQNQPCNAALFSSPSSFFVNSPLKKDSNKA